MNSPKKWLKDVVVVRFVDQGYKGNLIVLPSGIKHYEQIVEAEVVDMGSKYRYKEDTKKGDRIYVNSYLGTRRSFDDIGDVCVFDGEDILALRLK